MVAVMEHLLAGAAFLATIPKVAGGD